MTENHAVQVSCRIPKKLLTGIKNIGRPGTIVSTTMNQFYKVKINESTLETGTTITCPDESMLLISHNKDKILLTVTKGDQVMVIDFDEKTACHLILKLNLLVNLDR